MKTTSRSDAIAAELRGEILRGQYRVGERLPSERDLAERFSVHRSAVREAMKRLEQLGLVVIRPGGVRAAPIEEASLDVVEHLLELEDPPDPQIVDQVLETVGGLFGMAARLCAERADDQQRETIAQLLEQLGEHEQSAQDRIQITHQLGDVFVEASDNVVLKLVRRGVKTHVIEKLESRRPGLLAPLLFREPLLEALGRAIQRRDGAGAAEAVHELSHAIRRHALASLALERRAMSPVGSKENAS